MKSKEIQVQPVISEKSYAMANELNKYTFLIPRGVNKIELSNVVEEKYKVKVTGVNSIVRPGKMKKDWKSGKKNRKIDMLKVIVTLKKGDKIDEFLKN